LSWDFIERRRRSPRYFDGVADEILEYLYGGCLVCPDGGQGIVSDPCAADLKHIRVIYYDVTDPFWGTKLSKRSPRISFPRSDPEEAVFKGEGDRRK
jgi:hypothetical protein